MNRRHTLLLIAGCALLAVPVVGQQDRAVPRSGGGGGGGSHGGSHPSPGVSSSSGSSGGGSSYRAPSPHVPTTAQRRHPRAGTGSGSRYPGYRPGRPGYPGHPGYPGYPGYPGWGWGRGWGGYNPAYWGYWWPYGGAGWGWSGGYGYGVAPWGVGATYTYVETDRGSLRVFVDPSETRVYVDGYFAGVADDFDGLFQRLHVAPGRHEISLKLAGYQTHTVRVYVGSGSTLELDHEMEKGSGDTFEDLTGGAPREARRSAPPPGATPRYDPPSTPAAASGELHLSVEPVDASVYVNGEFRGTGREATALALAPGQHRVEVVRPGYRTAEREVEIAPQGVAELTIELKKP